MQHGTHSWGMVVAEREIPHGIIAIAKIMPGNFL
jgi:hypothetical protein